MVRWLVYELAEQYLNEYRGLCSGGKVAIDIRLMGKLNMNGSVPPLAHNLPW